MASRKSWSRAECSAPRFGNSRVFRGAFEAKTSCFAADSCIFETNDNVPLACTEISRFISMIRRTRSRSRSRSRGACRGTSTNASYSGHTDIHASSRRVPPSPCPPQECTEAFRPFPDSSALCFCRRASRGVHHGVITQLLRYLKNTNFHFNFPLTALSRAPKYKVNFLIIPAVSLSHRARLLRPPRTSAAPSASPCRFDVAIVFRRTIGTLRPRPGPPARGLVIVPVIPPCRKCQRVYLPAWASASELHSLHLKGKFLETFHQVTAKFSHERVKSGRSK